MGKEFTCNLGDTGDKGLVPGLGRSLGEGHGNLLQYSWGGSRILISSKNLQNSSWRILWTGEPSLQTIGLQRVEHDKRLSTQALYIMGDSQVVLRGRTYLPMQETQEMWVESLGRKIPWRRAWQPTLVFCVENPMDTGAWRVIVHRVTKSQTQLSMHAI